MKSRLPLLLIAAAVSPATLFLYAGCSKADDSKTVVQDAKASAANAVADVKVAAADSWEAIKDFAFERRADFSAGVDRMARALDDKTAALKAKFAAAPDAAATARDSAAKEYEEARADLKARLAELSTATADTWADARAKVEAAWKRVQASYDKLAKPDSP